MQLSIGTPISPLCTVLGMEKWAERIKAALDANPELDMPGLARATSTRPPSIHQWFNEQPSKPTTKMITGDNLVAAARYVGMSAEEIMTGIKSPSQAGRPTGDMLASAHRMAREALEIVGAEFDPEGSPEAAELLALALDDVIQNGVTIATDGDVYRFVRMVSGGRNARRSSGEDGGTGGDNRTAPDGEKARAARRKAG